MAGRAAAAIAFAVFDLTTANPTTKVGSVGMAVAAGTVAGP
jgi:hypothetical protein